MRQHKMGAPQHEPELDRSETPPEGSATEEKDSNRDGKKAAVALTTALKSFAATLSEHTERQSSLIDVFGAAFREMSAELQKSKTKSFTLEVRLRETENRLAQLEKMMAAWTRQGQGWLQ